MQLHFIDHSIVHRAARAIHGTDRSVSQAEFEAHYNCKIFNDPGPSMPYKYPISFNTEKDLSMFLLKWSQEI